MCSFFGIQNEYKNRKTYIFMIYKLYQRHIFINFKVIRSVRKLKENLEVFLANKNGNIPKLMGYTKTVQREKFITINNHIKRQEKSQIKNSNDGIEKQE